MLGISRYLQGLSLVATLLPAIACAGQVVPVTDMSMSIALSPQQELYPPGSVVRVDYTVHNAGPDDSPGSYSSTGEFAFSGPNSQIAVSVIEQTSPCDFASLDLGAPLYFHGYLFTTLTFPPIAAGTSVTCSLQFEVLNTARGTYVATGFASPVVSEATSIDPNPGNNVARVSMPLSEGPPPSTDLSLSLELVPAQPIYMPGSEVRLLVTARNNGPDATGGSRVTFDPAWVTDPSAPAAIIASSAGNVPRQCLDSLVPSQTSFGFTVDNVLLRDLDAGQSLTCEYRFFVLDSAPATFAVSAVSTPIPDFGDPTDDPVSGNDTASLSVRTAAGNVVASPSVVPTLSTTLLAMLAVAVAGLGACMAGARRR